MIILQYEYIYLNIEYIVSLLTTLLIKGNFMKNIILMILLLSLISADEIKKDNDSKIDFHYGMLSKASYNSKSNSVLSDSSEINTGDYLRINVGYNKNTNFCIIYHSADDEYMLLDNKKSDNSSNQEISYYTALHPTQLEPPEGTETFYFINSVSPLSDLISLLNKYENAPSKGKKKLSKRLIKKISSFNPKIKSELNSFSGRLEKPIAGGVAFRGEDDGINELSVTHKCSGENGVAFKKIVLIHK